MAMRRPCLRTEIHGCGYNNHSVLEALRETLDTRQFIQIFIQFWCKTNGLNRTENLVYVVTDQLVSCHAEQTILQRRHKPSPRKLLVAMGKK